MQSDFLNVLGALLVACAVLASHPMSNAQSSRLEDRFAISWNDMAYQQGCADLGTGACYFQAHYQAQHNPL
jgi:hypothetical protein